MTNPIINGEFDVWQLGTTFGGSLTNLNKLADRWNYDYNGTAGVCWVDRVLVQDWAKFPGFYAENGIRVNMVTAPQHNTFQDLSTQIEGVETFAGETITISFYATYYSGEPPLLTAVKTEQYFGSGGAPSPPAFTTSDPVQILPGAGVWRRYSITTTLASVLNKTKGTEKYDTFNIIFTLPLNRKFDIGITWVKVNIGTTAEPFLPRSVHETLQKCQRYLKTSYENFTKPGTITHQGVVAASAQTGQSSLLTLQTDIPMRVPPFVTFYNPKTGEVGSWDGAGSPVGVSVNTNSSKNITLKVDAGRSWYAGHYVLQDPML